MCDCKWVAWNEECVNKCLMRMGVCGCANERMIRKPQPLVRLDNIVHGWLQLGISHVFHLSSSVSNATQPRNRYDICQHKDEQRGAREREGREEWTLFFGLISILVIGDSLARSISKSRQRRTACTFFLSTCPASVHLFTPPAVGCLSIAWCSPVGNSIPICLCN